MISVHNHTRNETMLLELPNTTSDEGVLREYANKYFDALGFWPEDDIVELRGKKRRIELTLEPSFYFIDFVEVDALGVDGLTIEGDTE